ncbi:hypothetical protein ACOME3_004638 [Neoechinorhynchus agilis]
MFNSELFGNEEEKRALRKKVDEAGITASYRGYGLLARFVSASKVMSFFETGLKDQVIRANHLNVITQCLFAVRSGLMTNESLDLHTLLLVVNGVAQMALPHCIPSTESSENSVSMPNTYQDSHIIPDEPRRQGKITSSPKTGAFVFLSFSLHLLHKITRKFPVNNNRSIDPLIDNVVVKSLYCRNTDVLTKSLQCLNRLVPFSVRSPDNFNLLIERVINIIDRNISSTATLLPSAFKLLSTLLQYTESIGLELSNRLLTYVELQVFKDGGGDASALILLRSILKQHLVPTDIHKFIRRFIEQVIRHGSQFSSSFQQIAKIMGTYLKSYELRIGDVEQLVVFLGPNLHYDDIKGREVTCDMLSALIGSLPVVTVNRLMPALTTALLTSMFNETRSEGFLRLRTLLKSLLTRVDVPNRQSQFDRFVNCIEIESKVQLRITSIQALSVALEVDFDLLKHHFLLIFKSIYTDFCHLQDILNSKPINDDLRLKHFSEQPDVIKNQYTFYAVSLILDVIKGSSGVSDLLDSAWNCIVHGYILRQTDVGIRLKSCDLVNECLLRRGSINPKDFRLLVRLHCQMLRSTKSVQVTDHITRNMFHLTRSVIDKETYGPDEVRFVAARMRREGDFEAAHNLGSCTSRQAALKFFASLTILLKREQFHKSLSNIIVPLIQREFGKDDNQLKDLAMETWSTIEGMYGEEAHLLVEVYNKSKKVRSERKIKRKERLAITKVREPVLAAERKITRRKEKGRRKADRKLRYSTKKYLVYFLMS